VTLREIRYYISLQSLVDLREESATYGYENNPTYPAAVRNFRQYTNVWPSKSVEVKKTMVVVKLVRSGK